jgi:uridine kinase
MSLILGLVGEKGSGKGTFFEHLQTLAGKKTIAQIRSSDLLGETLDLWNIPRNRRNLQDLAIVMDNHFGKGTLTHAISKRITAAHADIIIFDGIRWKTDAEMIRGFPNNLLMYITADVKTRYTRTKKRKEKVGESMASFEMFLEEEKVGTELDIPMIGTTADIHIKNTGSLDDYKQTIQKVFQEKILPRI